MYIRTYLKHSIAKVIKISLINKLYRIIATMKEIIKNTKNCQTRAYIMTYLDIILKMYPLDALSKYAEIYEEMITFSLQD